MLFVKILCLSFLAIPLFSSDRSSVATIQDERARLNQLLDENTKQEKLYVQQQTVQDNDQVWHYLEQKRLSLMNQLAALGQDRVEPRQEMKLNQEERVLATPAFDAVLIRPRDAQPPTWQSMDHDSKCANCSSGKLREVCQFYILPCFYAPCCMLVMCLCCDRCIRITVTNRDAE